MRSIPKGPYMIACNAGRTLALRAPLALALLLDSRALAQDDSAAPASQPVPALRVELSPCNATRPKMMHAEDVSMIGLLTGAVRSERLVRKGAFRPDPDRDETFDILLPAADAKSPYSLSNVAREDTYLYNTSTCISIDATRDGQHTADECWFASLPLRIGDRMFEVAAIDEQGAYLELRPSSVPLRGLIVGRKSPAFAFKTIDGVELTSASLAGKAFLLDIWSVT